MNVLKHKIPPPLVAIICGLIMWWLSSITYLMSLPQVMQYSLSMIIFIIGATFSIAGVIAFRSAKTTVNPLKPSSASSLVTNGVFQLSRNPMYVGLAFILLAWAIFLMAPWSISIIVVFVFYIHWFQIKPEEEAISALFGEEFKQYKATVRPWL